MQILWVIEATGVAGELLLQRSEPFARRRIRPEREKQPGCPVIAQ